MRDRSHRSFQSVVFACAVFVALFSGAAQAQGTPAPDAGVPVLVIGGQAPPAPPAEAPAVARTAVLLGEKPRVRVEEDSVRAADIAAITSAALGMKVVDLTIEKETAAALAKRVERALREKPDVVIVFTGSADEKAGTRDEAVIKALSPVVKGLSKECPSVFLVPSSTSLGAAASANLRIAATETGTTFVEPGTEIGGRPYEDALAEVRRQLTEARLAPAPTPKPAKATQPGPAMVSQETTGGTVQTVAANAAQTPATIYMVPPPALKRFDPRETPVAKERRGRAKRPAIAN